MQFKYFLSFAFLIVLTSETSPYTPVLTIANPLKLQKPLFSYNLSYFILYDDNQNNISAYNTYSWKPISHSSFTNFEDKPSLMVSFDDGKRQMHNILYFNKEKKVIKRKMFDNNQAS